jgi:HECT-domain (ubiquitin-transferase)
LQRLARDINSDFSLWSVTNYPSTKAIFAGTAEFIRSLDLITEPGWSYIIMAVIFRCSSAVLPAFQAAFDWQVPVRGQHDHNWDIREFISMTEDEEDNYAELSPKVVFSPSYKFSQLQRALRDLRAYYWYTPEALQDDGYSEEEKWSHQTVVIDRDSLIKSSKNAFKSVRRTKLWHALKVTWDMEHGDDQGGPFREWVTLLINELLKPENKVVKPYPEHNSEARTHQLVRFSNRDSDGAALARTLGFAVGLAFANVGSISLSFPLFVYRALCSAECAQDVETFRWTLKDLEDIDQDLMLRLSEFRKESIGVPAARTVASDIGLDVPADLQSEDEIKEHIVQHRIEQSLVGDATGFRDFVESFLAVMSASPEPEYAIAPLLSALIPVEMRALISGDPIRPSEPALDLCSVQKYVRYHEFDKKNELDMELKREFWSILKAYDSDQQGRLLAFITGSKQLPYKWKLRARGQESKENDDGQEDEQPFKLHLVKNSAFRLKLPWSSTCAAALYIPSIPCSELKPKLDLCLQHCTGFGLV